MTKIFTLLILIGTVSYGQKKVPNPTLNQHLWSDTNKIAILPLDKKASLFKDAKELKLTNTDLRAVYKILNDCVQTHNIKHDTTKELNDFIDLKKYKLQYVPFISSNGQRKVYVNAFRDFNLNFDLGWKKGLITVYDCGICNFDLVINLTKNNYQEFSYPHHR